MSLFVKFNIILLIFIISYYFRYKIIDFYVVYIAKARYNSCDLPLKKKTIFTNNYLKNLNLVLIFLIGDH